jgi:predicted DNA-binding transcriptional regulator YafY
MRYSTARPPLKRMMAIHHALRAQTWPTDSSLAGALEVNPRTIRRDLTYMQDQLRAPIAFDRGRQGYGYTQATYQLPFLRLTEGELVALFLAEQMLRQYRGTPYGPDRARLTHN